MLFERDIQISEEALESAYQSLQTAAQECNALALDIRNALENLQSGWRTPAGQRFAASAQGCIAYLQDSAAALSYIGRNLHSAKSAYESVFEEYKAFDRTIRDYENNE